MTDKYEAKIEDGIDIPPARMKAKKVKWPTQALEVGQSFLLPDKEGQSRVKTWVRARSIVSYAKIMMPEKRFATRSVEGGVRIWRIA